MSEGDHFLCNIKINNAISTEIENAENVRPKYFKTRFKCFPRAHRVKNPQAYKITRVT